MQRFASWCILWPAWWWWHTEISFLATTYVGALQTKNQKVQEWSEPVYQAFLAGAWIVLWTETTLYWVPKPIVCLETGRRLHNETHAALQSTVENMYFWHGVMVPAFVVVRPEWITVEHIRREENAEVRRVMVERMGWDKYCSQAGMRVIHEDRLQSQFPALPQSELVPESERLVVSYRSGEETAQLLEATELKDFEDRPLRFVRVTDPSTGRQYTIRVKHNHTRCYQAIGASFGMTEKQYKESVYQRQGDVCLKPLGKTSGKQIHS